MDAGNDSFYLVRHQTYILADSNCSNRNTIISANIYSSRLPGVDSPGALRKNGAGVR